MKPWKRAGKDLEDFEDLSHKGIWGFYNGTTYSFHQVTLSTLASKLLMSKTVQILSQAGG